MIANLAYPAIAPSPALPPSALGFASEPKRDLAKALQAARASARTMHPRNCLRRLAYLLCEVSCTADEVRKNRDRLPLTRERLSEALGISLSKVKRILALLSLSQVIRCEDRAIRVLDWRRLSTTAGFDRDRMGYADDGDEFEAPPCQAPQPQLLTRSGDPAFFG